MVKNSEQEWAGCTRCGASGGVGCKPAEGSDLICNHCEEELVSEFSKSRIS